MTIKKPRVYLDTSIWSFYFADDSPERRDLTRELFDDFRQHRYEPCISAVVLEEIDAAPEPLRTKLNALLDEITPTVLQIGEAALDLSRQYIQQGTIPQKYDDDALHIAVAVANNMDLLLSWNFAHIVKLRTRRVVSATSKLLGYKEIEICSPEEVVDNAS